MKPLAHSATYVESTQTNIHDIVSILLQDLGAPLVQSIAGSKDSTAPHRWAHPEGTGPGSIEEQRLRLGYRVLLSLEPLCDPAAASTWLRSINPELNGETPVAFIQQLHTREVVAMAEAFAAHTVRAR